MWAIGDVTGIMPFTHVAKYQGRVVADGILGRPRAARYEGIPRVVFADPEIATAGLTQAEADRQGLNLASVELDLTGSLARPWTYECDPRGRLGLLADTDRRLLVGAWAVAPQAAEWIHQAAWRSEPKFPSASYSTRSPNFPPTARAISPPWKLWISNRHADSLKARACQQLLMRSRRDRCCLCLANRWPRRLRVHARRQCQI